jgi:PAS domain S-box-containing protein
VSTAAAAAGTPSDPARGFAFAVFAMTAGAAVLALLANLVTRHPEAISPIWLGDAYATCWLLARRHRAWPEWPALLLAMAGANVSIGLLFGYPWSVSLSFVPINVGAVWVAAVLLGRCCMPHCADLPPRVLALALLMGGVVPSALGGLLAWMLLPELTRGDPAGFWVAWVIGGVAGALTVLPVGLHVIGRRRLPSLSASSLGLLVATVMLSALALWGLRQPFVYICMLLVTLAALRGYAVTSVGVLVVSTLISLMWATGLYVDAPVASPWDAIFNHLPHAVALVPALLLAARAQQSEDLQARFDGLYLSAPEAIALTGPGGTLLAANPAAEKLLGLSEAEMKPRGVDGLIDPADARRGTLLAERESLGSAHGMLRLRRGDGSLVECDVSTAQYRMPSGEWASHSFVRDATPRLQQEQALREAADLLQRLSDMVPGALSVFEAGPDGRLRVPWASRALTPLLGVSLQDAALSADAVFRHVPPADLERLGQRFADSARELSLLDEEFAVHLPGQGPRWMAMHSMPLRLADGATQWHGYIADVSERRAAAEKIRQQGARLELALASGGIGTWDNDIRRGTNTTSERWHALLGFRPGEFEQTLEAFDALVHPDDLPPLLERRFSAQKGAQDEVLLYRARHRNGSWRWMESRAVVVERDEVGKPLRLMGTAIDVTERIEADRLRAERDRAEAADRAKTAFMSRMSHELRTPLNAVLGFTQVLASDPDGRLDSVQREQLGQVMTSSEHLLSLINDLLDLSRVESGELVVQREPLAVAALLDEARASMAPLARRAGVDLQTEPVDPTLGVLGDRVRVRQVLMNLVSNAIKYNARGGRVRLRCEVVAGQVALEVQDTGRGLTADQQAHLFEPFNRLGAEASGVEGAGIGLTISRQLVERMGGRIEVSSHPGDGSRFRALLPSTTVGLPSTAVPAVESLPTAAPPVAALPVPVAAVAAVAEPASRVGTAPRPPPQAPALPAQAQAAMAQGRQLRVLYAEDNPVNVTLLQMMTRRRADVLLTVARSGQEALLAARQQPLDLLLADMNLGDMTGLDLAATLHGEPATARLRCVALSADALPMQIEAARQAGFAGYLTKPLRMADLFKAFDDAWAEVG